MLINTHNTRAIYLADPSHLRELCDEIGEVTTIIGNLVFSPRIKTDVCFAQDAWFEPVITRIDSISHAVKQLKTAGKWWYLYPLENMGRARLIAAELRKLPPLQHEFPLTEALPDIGCFTLLDKNTLIYSTRRLKRAPLGNFQFIEDKTNPPNRAYLKLWEALSLFGAYPKAGETAIDLGASPGGWTYVMQTFGACVIAVDKAPLAPHIAELPNVTFQAGSAFAIDPRTFDQPLDWVLCDVACYPERTYQLIQQWLAAGKAKNMVFTIKLQGETDLTTLAPFQAIPGGRVLHLFYNKHEVTFLYRSPAL